MYTTNQFMLLPIFHVPQLSFVAFHVYPSYGDGPHQLDVENAQLPLWNVCVSLSCDQSERVLAKNRKKKKFLDFYRVNEQSRKSSLRSIITAQAWQNKWLESPIKGSILYWSVWNITIQTVGGKIPRSLLVTHLKAGNLQFCMKSDIKFSDLNQIFLGLLISQLLVKGNKDPGYEGE